MLGNDIYEVVNRTCNCSCCPTNIPKPITTVSVPEGVYYASTKTYSNNVDLQVIAGIAIAVILLFIFVLKTGGWLFDDNEKKEAQPKQMASSQ